MPLSYVTPGRRARTARLGGLLALALASVGATLGTAGPAQAMCLAPAIEAGTYRNIDPNTRSVTTVRLDTFRCGDTVLNGRLPPTGFPLAMWGSCSPRDCRFPDAFAHAQGGNRFLATIDQGYARRTILIEPRGDRQIRLTLRTEFTDPARQDYSDTMALAR